MARAYAADLDSYRCGMTPIPIGVGGRPARSQDRAMTQNSTEKKKTALVTGANKGIGYEIAAGLARRGFRVGVGARDEGRRNEAVEKLRAEGLDVFGVPLDVTDDASVAAAATQLEGQGGL